MYCVNTYSNVALFTLPKKENEDAAKWTPVYPAGRKLSLEFKFRYFTNSKFAKFQFRLLVNFEKALNDSLYDWNSKIEFRVYFHPVG